MAVSHTIRTRHGKTRKVSLTPLSAIRAHCLECVCWVTEEVRHCTGKLCPLSPFRFGRNPSRAGIGNAQKGHLRGTLEADFQQTAATVKDGTGGSF